MSTTPIDQEPPPTAMTQQAYTTHSGHGSVGPVIAVLAVITILGVIAGMIGRLCSGRPIMGHGQYDFEGWVERKCSTCLDGRVDLPPPPPRPPANTSGVEVPVAMPVEIQQEIKEEEEEEEQPPQRQQQRHQHNNSSQATTSNQS
ncbi:hypothetical protein FEM48_Zijuj09G0117500 [Ziziphus jujuba var. spinosa]|uniref:Uncharacterized protein n=1 Tax=Ziziphus jujuba var. spinosa TaxID=714518 RepID=A0A978UST9_ZIZJJ|nr:hypothetical protein FEM48_Zijuj09G0117500 [Ziziphus jujuba var. spinosa]